MATRAGAEEVVRVLLRRGANKEARRDTDETPLHFAVENGHFGVATILLDEGADVNAVGARGTPLRFTRTLGSQNLVELLEMREGISR